MFKTSAIVLSSYLVILLESALEIHLLDVLQEEVRLGRQLPARLLLQIGGSSGISFASLVIHV